MRKLLLSLALVGALAVPAAAQVNSVPQIGNINSITKLNTYSAVSVGLVPAASATDIFCISGSSSRGIGIKKISISGTAGTLVTAPFTLVRRATLDTGGTAATTTALPVASSHISTQPAATAVLTAYTANPTINDASPLYFESGTLSLNVTSALVSNPPLLWQSSTPVDFLARSWDIPAGSTTQQYCVNLNAISVTSGLLNISITWVEG